MFCVCTSVFVLLGAVAAKQINQMLASGPSIIFLGYRKHLARYFFFWPDLCVQAYTI